MVVRIPSRGSDQFNLRFPDGMRDEIRRAAEASGRSMNAEIIYRLQTTLGMNEDTIEPETIPDEQTTLTDREKVLVHMTIRQVFDDLEKAGVLPPIPEGNRLSDLEKVFKDKDGE